MSAHEYGAVKLIHGRRFFETSALAVLTAELTEAPQKVRRTPSRLPMELSHVVGSVFDLYVAPT
jgi:hypothetical protein